MSLHSFQKIFLLFSIALALGLRLHASVDETSLPQKDAADYDQLALSILEGKGYRNGLDELTARRPPLYPVFLAGIYRLGGHNYQIARIAQAVLSALTVFLIYKCSVVLFGSGAACWAAILAALYPSFYAYSYSCPALVSETLYTFLLTAYFWSLFHYFSKPSWWVGILSGITLGLAILTRPIPLFLPVFLPLSLIVLGQPWSSVLRYLGLLCATLLVVLLPWTIRNYRVFGEFVPVGTIGGDAFYRANHPGSDGIGGGSSGEDPFFRDIFFPQYHRLHSMGKSEVEMSRYFFGKGMEFFRDHRREAFKLGIWKILMFNDARTVIEKDSTRVRVVNYGYLIVLLGTLASFVLAGSNPPVRRSLLLMALIYGYFLAVHTILPSSERMRFPLEPLLIIAAAFSFHSIAQRLFLKKSP
jgi:hypothetical protein